jgi:hypothetical protein
MPIRDFVKSLAPVRKSFKKFLEIVKKVYDEENIDISVPDTASYIRG